MIEATIRPKIRDGRSSLAAVSPYYAGGGWWPMTQWVESSGLTYRKHTAATGTDVDTTNDWFSGVSASTWITAGLPIKLHNTNTIPAGLSPNVIYYAGKPTSDRLTFHTNEADAIAGTNKVNITSVGTGSVIVYDAQVFDYSGQGNNLLVGTSIRSVTSGSVAGIYDYGAPFMSSSTNASVDCSLGRLPLSVFSSYAAWPAYSILFAWRWKPRDVGSQGIVEGGRSIAGIGAGSVSDGFRVQTGPAGSEKNRVTALMFYGGSGVSNSLGSASRLADNSVALDTETCHLVLFDANSLKMHQYINGELDLKSQYVSLSSVGSVTPSSDFFIGGTYNGTIPTCQGAGFSDVHLMWIPQSKVITRQKLDALAMHLATTRYYRVMEGDL